MIQNANKYSPLNIIHRFEDRKTMYAFSIIAAVLLVLGYVVGQAFGLTSYAKGTGSNVTTSQATVQQAIEVNQDEIPQQLSVTNIAPSNKNSVPTTLLTIGAITFAALGAVRVYKVMTD